MTRKEVPGSGACLSFGSLKTEEKTERQCGQFEAGLRVGWVELSVNFAAGHPAGGNTDTGRSDARLRAGATIDRTARTLRRPPGSFPPVARRSLTLVPAHPSTSVDDRIGHVFVGEFDPGSG